MKDRYAWIVGFVWASLLVSCTSAANLAADRTASPSTMAPSTAVAGDLPAIGQTDERQNAVALVLQSKTLGIVDPDQYPKTAFGRRPCPFFTCLAGAETERAAFSFYGANRFFNRVCLHKK